MKTARKLIEAYEAEGGFSGIRLYGYVRPIRNGEAGYEIYAAANSRNKGRPLMTKCIYRMRTDKPDNWMIRDCIEYHSWSQMCHDHIIVDFHEHGGPTRRDFEKMHVRGGYKRGEWTKAKCDRLETGRLDAMLPIAPVMLNGFAGTKYQYCAYTARTGLAFADYLHLYGITPKVELLAKAELWQLLTVDICEFLNRNPRFGKFLAKHWQEAKLNYWTPYRAKREYARLDPVCAEEVRKAKREEAERRKAVAEAKRRKEIAAEKRKAKKHDKAIRELYERVKDICATYGAYEVEIPANSAAMLDEGEAMHNCIGKIHAPLVAKGEELCLFFRKDGKPCVDVAISLKTYKVKEIRAVCNLDAPMDARELADRLADEVKIRLAA